MARYPKAFEVWYKGQINSSRGLDIDETIIKMRDNNEAKTLKEGEQKMRKMMFVEWLIENKKL